MVTGTQGIAPIEYTFGKQAGGKTYSGTSGGVHQRSLSESVLAMLSLFSEIVQWLRNPQLLSAISDIVKFFSTLVKV